MLLRYYMGFTMRLLLVLSAFLTAFVGLGTAVPAVARPACEMSSIVSTKVERFAPVTVTVSTPGKASLDRVNFVAFTRADAPVAVMPIYADRLRV